MNIDYISIGARIKYFRTQKSLSQEELAEFANVSPVYISNIERGEKSASLKTIIAVANAMSISTDSILMDNLSHSDDSRERAIFDILLDCTMEEHDLIVKCMKVLKNIIRHYNITKI